MDIFGGSSITDASKMLFGQYNDGKMFFFNVAANPIGFFNNMIERLTIGANGKVGVSNTNPLYQLDITGDGKSSGNFIANNMLIGDVGHGATWAGIGNSSIASTTGYALLQNSAGTSVLLNKKSGGGSISFRVDNTDMASMDDSGIFTINNMAGSGTRLVTAGSTGVLDDATIGNGVILSSGALGLTGQALALHNLSSNGLIARTSSGNVSARTITAGNGISVTNGDGVSGNPTIAQSMKYASARNGGTETFDLTLSVLKKLDIAVDQQSQGITVDVTDNWLELPETGDYEVTICGQFESSDGEGNYYIALHKNSDVGVVDGVILKNPQGYVPFSFTVIEGFTAGDNIYGSIYCSTSETGEKMHNYKITAKRLY